MSPPRTLQATAVALVGACIGAVVGWTGAKHTVATGPIDSQGIRPELPGVRSDTPHSGPPELTGRENALESRLSDCERELEMVRSVVDTLAATTPSITVPVPARFADSQQAEGIASAVETIRRRCAPDLMLGPIDCDEYPCLALTTSTSPETAMAVMDCAHVEGYFANPLDHLEITVDGRSAVGAVMAFYTDGQTQVTDDAQAEQQRTKERAATLVEHGSDWLHDTGVP